jgi:recombination protein RecA
MATAAKKKAAAKPAPAKKARGRASLAEDDTPVRSSRRSLEDDVEDPELAQHASNYFAKVESEDKEFVSTGAATLNCAAGGGWVLGRVVNLVGDKSAGKTLLAIEACTNFRIQYPKDPIRYAESEHAFDEPYAAALGLPVESVEFAEKTDPATGKKRSDAKPIRTVEDWYKDMKAFLDRCKASKSKRGLYVIDSLDALSDEAEMKREMGEGTFGVSKPKLLGELFRRLIADMDECKVMLIVVSQLKDKIGVTFGEKQTRAGGRALDYYATHIVWLADLGQIKKTVSGIERMVGRKIRARFKKNKVSLPFRECEYPIIFGYGIDDLTSNAEWLIEHGREELLREHCDMSKSGYAKRIEKLRDLGGEPVRIVRETLRKLVYQEWEKVERSFLPKARKY